VNTRLQQTAPFKTTKFGNISATGTVPVLIELCTHHSEMRKSNSSYKHAMCTAWSACCTAIPDIATLYVPLLLSNGWMFHNAM